jgi:hypothetical protein
MSGTTRTDSATNNLEIGDTVECIGESSGLDGDSTYGGGGWKSGYIFKIDHFSHNNEICWDISNNGIWCHHIRLIQEIGGKIKLKSYEKYSDYIAHVGQEAEITERVSASEYDYRIKWIDGVTSLVKLNNIVGINFKLAKPPKPLVVGDIVTCAPSNSDPFAGEGQIVYNDGIRYHIRRLDGHPGGGLLLENGGQCWRIALRHHNYLTKVRHSKIEIRISKQIKRIFKIEDEIFSKVTRIIGKVTHINYNNGFPTYTIITYPKNTTTNIAHSETVKATDKLKTEVCYQCLLKKLSRDTLGTKEENELIQPGCVAEVRNLEVCEKEYYTIGKRYIIVNSADDYENAAQCTISKGELKDYYHINKSYFKFVKDLRSKYTIKVSSLVIKTFNQYKGDKSPILLLGKNSKGVIDVVFTATDMSGCDSLAGMPPEAFASTLRNIILTKREWVGYGIIYYGSKPRFFTDLSREFIKKDTNFDRFYICILPRTGVYPYKLIKYDGHLQLLPVNMVIVD